MNCSYSTSRSTYHRSTMANPYRCRKCGGQFGGPPGGELFYTIIIPFLIIMVSALFLMVVELISWVISGTWWLVSTLYIVPIKCIWV